MHILAQYTWHNAGYATNVRLATCALLYLLVVQLADLHIAATMSATRLTAQAHSWPICPR